MHCFCRRKFISKSVSPQVALDIAECLQVNPFAFISIAGGHAKLIKVLSDKGLTSTVSAHML